MRASLPPSPERILLIRLSAFGDVVIATSLLHTIRWAHPEARVDWLVQPEMAALLKTQPGIGEIIVWARRDWGAWFSGLRWWRLAIAIWRFAAQLRGRRYDWVIDAQGLAKSRALAVLAGGTFRIGYSSKEPLGGLMHQRVQRHAEGHPERAAIGSEHAPMAAALGLGALLPPAMTAPGADGPYVVLAPFTTRPQKHWPEAHWRQLIARLTAQGLALQLLGGPADVKAASRLVEGFAIDDRVGRTNLVEAMHLVAGARAVVGVDTGLTHLAIALGRPTVALFGSTLPYATAANATVLSLRLPCSPCARAPSCGGQWNCLADLDPIVVERALLARLESAAARATVPAA